MKTSLLTNLIQTRKAKIGVIGLGYVGLPLSLRFAEKGFCTIGFDIDSSKVNKLNNCKTYINHITEKDIKKALNKGFIATSNYKLIQSVDVIIICVPTPLNKKNNPDLSYIKSTLNSIGPFLSKNQLLILESTSYPGTTEEIILDFVNKKSLKKTALSVGENFFIGYSPEREDPGNEKYSIKNIPKIVSGVTKNCLEVTDILYSQIVNKTVNVSSTKVAEMAKILENIQRAVNIGMMNEMKIICSKLDINIFEVIDAASTKPFGFMPFYPGPGLGGHCIPIDPFYLSWKANKSGINTEFINLAASFNLKMPLYVIKKIIEALLSIGIKIQNSKILILGLSYKKNIDDIRESPSLKIIDLLLRKGAHIQYSDPYINSIPSTRKYNIKLNSVKLSPKNLKFYDAVVLLTDHDSYNYDLIFKHSKIIIDTKGCFNNSKKVFVA